MDADDALEVAEVDVVRAPRAAVVDVREPLTLERYFGQNDAGLVFAVSRTERLRACGVVRVRARAEVSRR